MADEQLTLTEEELDQVSKGAPPPSTIDLAPSGSLVVPAAALRMVEAVTRVEELSDYDQNMLVLYISLGAQKGKEERSRLWKLARAPKKLWDECVQWQWDTPAQELTALSEMLAPEMDEYKENTNLLDPTDGESDGSEGNANGSPKS